MTRAQSEAVPSKQKENHVDILHGYSLISVCDNQDSLMLLSKQIPLLHRRILVSATNFYFTVAEDLVMIHESSVSTHTSNGMHKCSVIWDS
jgi:hypothetical protein